MKSKYSYLLLGFLSLFSFAQKNFVSNASPIQKQESASADEALQLFFFNVRQGQFTLLKYKNEALIVDAGSIDKKFSDISSSFEKALGGAKIKAIVLTNNSKQHSNFLKKIRKNYCPNCAIVNVQNQKIRLFHTKNDCEYLSLMDSNDLQQLASFLNKTFPTLTFKFPTNLKPSNPTKTKDTALTFIIEYQGTKLLFTGNTNSTQFNQLVDFKQKHTDPLKKHIVEENTAVFSNVKLFRMPICIKDKESIFSWLSFLVKNNFLQSAFIIDNTTNEITYPDDIKNKLQLINISQGTVHLKADAHGCKL